MGVVALGVFYATSAIAIELAPVNWSGSLGYNYRLLDGSAGHHSASRQGTASLFANSYIWRPWFATGDANATFALDSSTSSDERPGNAAAYTHSNSSILTGGLNLNVLPQSKSPSFLRYSVSDTRVDNSGFDSDAFIVLRDLDSKSYKLGLRQSWLFDGGHRLYGTYDNNRWVSERNGLYADESVGVQGEFLARKNRLSLNWRQQNAVRSVSSEQNTTTLVDVTHYFTPSTDFRVDSRANIYDMEREFDVPNSTQSGIGTLYSTQASSFVFFRPPGGRWSLSGGLRLYDISGENGGYSNDSQSLSLTGGGFYQYNKRLRFDASTSFSTVDSNNIEGDVTRQHAGMLYQSDLILWRDYTYNWFGTAAVENVDDVANAFQTYLASAAHSLARSWSFESGNVFRVNGTQAFSESYFTEFEDQQARIDHTVSVGWSRNTVATASFVRFTVSDRRSFGHDEGDQQFYNLQANRTQSISRRSSINGNVTIQHVAQDFSRVKQDSNVTTTTGRVDYRNSAIFGVPKLGFFTGYLVSVASEAQGFDRQEVENRLDYHIGQLSTSLTIRYIDYEDLDYWLTFFRIERNF